MSTCAPGPTYRNQYLVARGRLDRPLGGIAAVPLGPVTLYPGPALKWHFEPDADRWVLLIGEALDTTAPERTNADIAGRLLRGCDCRAAFLSAVHDLAGRYVILRGESASAIAIGDAIGQRQIYFGDTGTGLMLTSSPRMFFDCAGLEIDVPDDTRQLLQSRAFTRTEHAWYGDEFLDPRLKKVLPNHVLDLDAARVTRLAFAARRFDSTDDLLDYASATLVATIRAMANRGPLVQAITAGWDSRLLLAASRPCSAGIDYFVFDNPGTSPSPDAQIAAALARRLKLKFERVIRPALTEDFLAAYRQEHVVPRVMYTTSHIQHFAQTRRSGAINVNGNGGEIIRCYHGAGGGEACLKTLTTFTGYGDAFPRFTNAIARWREAAAPVAKAHGIPLLDFFEWEQSMGNWAATAYQELDWAIETISPFNHRGFLLACLALPEAYRRSPDSRLFRDLAVRLWPEVLQVPVNPHQPRLVAWIKANTALHYAIRSIQLKFRR